MIDVKKRVEDAAKDELKTLSQFAFGRGCKLTLSLVLEVLESEGWNIETGMVDPELTIDFLRTKFKDVM